MQAAAALPQHPTPAYTPHPHLSNLQRHLPPASFHPGQGFPYTPQGWTPSGAHANGHASGQPNACSFGAADLGPLAGLVNLRQTPMRGGFSAAGAGGWCR